MTKLGSVVFSRQDIATRIYELGRAITGDHAGREPFLVAVLPGATVFLADLVRAIDLPVQVHPIALSRYGPSGADPPGKVGTGRVRIVLDVAVPIDGRDVLLVQDIVDTGLTTRYLLATLRDRNPASLELCTLLDRPAHRIVPVTARYTGFECPDPFMVGYGLGIRRRHRHLPDIRTAPSQGPA